jgi:signal transduction histidine kinase
VSDRRDDSSSILLFVVLVGLAGWTLGVGGLRADGAHDPAPLAVVMRFVAADAFLIGGVLRLVRWRRTGDPQQRTHAIGLFAASLLFPLTTVLTPWAVIGGHPTPLGVVARGAGLLAVIPLLSGRVTCPGRTAALMLLGAGQALRVAGIVAPGHLDELAPGFDVAAALLLIGAALLEFRDLLRAGDAREGELELELASTQARLERDRRAQQERLHDARSAVAGVLGASAVLEHDEPATADRTVLHQLMAAEVRRLADLLGIESGEPITEFDVAEALTPVLRLHHLEFAGLHWDDLDGIIAVGRPRATATALDNLLRNARVHAPGAAVRVFARTVAGGGVRITVDDDGPGIPLAERSLVVQRGRRGAGVRAAGSGLGLANVRRAMTEQRGGLELDASPSGGLRATLTLPQSERAMTAA